MTVRIEKPSLNLREELAKGTDNTLDKAVWGDLTVNGVGSYDRQDSTDGVVLELNKEGITVGSLNSKNGHLVIGNDDIGIIFNKDANNIYPWTLAGDAASTGSIDLGSSTARWKDLYLSGNISFGAGSGLQISHDGSSGLIQNDTGALFLNASEDNKDIFLQSDDGLGGLAIYLQADGSTGSVNLRHYGLSKLATTATGIDVNGTATMNGLTVDGKFTPYSINPTNDGLNTGAAGQWVKLGNWVASGSQNCEITLWGTQAYGSGDSCSGKTIISLRGDNSTTTVAGHFYGETEGNTLATEVGYVNTIANTFEIYIRVGTFYSVEYTVNGAGAWTPDLVLTASVADPVGIVKFNSLMGIATNGVARLRVVDNGAVLIGTAAVGDASATDLVVQGGLYLGGNATANRMDDYEEGTTTPAIVGSNSGTITCYADNDNLKYTKIGNMVFVTGRFYVSSVSGSPSGDIRIPLPFAVHGLTSDYSAYAMGNANVQGTTKNQNAFICQANESEAYMRVLAEDGSDTASLIGALDAIIVTLTYQTA